MAGRRYSGYYQTEDPLENMPYTTRHRNFREMSSDKMETTVSLGHDEHCEPSQEELMEFSDEQMDKNDDLFADDSENDVSESGESNDNFSEGKLYDGCPLSADESALLVLQFAVAYKITGAALVSILKLLKAHLPEGTEYFTYINQLKNFFNKSAEIPLAITQYCNNCLTMTDEHKYCTKCNKHIENAATSHFMKLSTTSQIQTFFDDPEFEELLNYRFTRTKYHSENIEDVYDGVLYKKLLENQLNDKYNLSLKVNTDGVAIFKSSSYHLWPIYFQLNELPPDKRTQRKYRILGGLWCGRKKPDMTLMFQPMASELKSLEQDGHEFKLPDGTTVYSKIYALSGHFDTPAKDDFLHKVHHNGAYGCSFCEDKGESVPSGRGYTHVYPVNFETDTGFGKARTSEGVKENAASAIIENKAVFGIKKPCPFLELEHFDVVNSISVDYMHTVCLGVTKRLLQIWFTDKSHPSYIGSKEVDEYLVNITPPNFVTRTPRAISENLKHYKASELKMWLLHYGPVCLNGILEKKYYDHFLYLSKGIYNLLSKSISSEMLDESDRCFRTFCSLTEELYGIKFLTINFHLLLHIVETVKQLGPLWSSSCFSFEDYNRELGDFIHGTQHVQQQILSAVSFLQKVPSYTRKLNENSVVADLLEDLTNKHKVSFKDKVQDGIYILGGTEKKQFKTLPQGDRRALCHLLPVWGWNTVKIFSRVYIHGSIFHSKSYKRAFKRNSYSIKFMSHNGPKYGQIKYFGQLGEGTQAVSFALVDLFDTVSLVQNEHIALHIVRVERQETVLAIPLQECDSVCVYMTIDNSEFISEIPNTYECD